MIPIKLRLTFPSDPLCLASQERSFLELMQEEQTFQEKTVGQMMESPLTLRNPYHPIQCGYSAYSVVEALSRQLGLHRVPVIDHHRNVLNLVTQSQVVSWLFDHLDLLGYISEKKIQDCHRCLKEVLTVTEDSTTLEAFEKMATHNVQVRKRFTAITNIIRH